MYHHNNRQTRGFNRNPVHQDPYDNESRRREWVDPQNQPNIRGGFRGRAHRPPHAHPSSRDRPPRPHPMHQPHPHEPSKYDSNLDRYHGAPYRGNHKNMRVPPFDRGERVNAQYSPYPRGDFHGDHPVERDVGRYQPEVSIEHEPRRPITWEKPSRNAHGNMMDSQPTMDKSGQPPHSYEEDNTPSSAHRPTRPEHVRSYSEMGNTLHVSRHSVPALKDERGTDNFVTHETQQARSVAPTLEVKKTPTTVYKGERLTVIKHKVDANAPESATQSSMTGGAVTGIGKRQGSFDRLVVEKPVKKQRFSQSQSTNESPARSAESSPSSNKQPTPNEHTSAPAAVMTPTRQSGASIQEKPLAHHSRFSQRHGTSKEEPMKEGSRDGVTPQASPFARVSSYGPDATPGGHKGQSRESPHRSSASQISLASRASFEGEYNPAPVPGETMTGQKTYRHFREPIRRGAVAHHTLPHDKPYRDSRGPMHSGGARDEIRGPHRPEGSGPSPHWRHPRDGHHPNPGHATPPPPTSSSRFHSHRYGSEPYEVERMHDKPGPSRAHHPQRPYRHTDGGVYSHEDMDARSHPNAPYAGTYPDSRRPPHRAPSFTVPELSKRYTYPNTIPDSLSSHSHDHSSHAHYSEHRSEEGPLHPQTRPAPNLERVRTYPPVPGAEHGTAMASGPRAMEEGYRATPPPHAHMPPGSSGRTGTYHGRRGMYGRDMPLRQDHYSEREDAVPQTPKYDDVTPWSGRGKDERGYPESMSAPQSWSEHRHDAHFGGPANTFRVRPSRERPHPKQDHHGDHYVDDYPMFRSPPHRAPHGIGPQGDMVGRVHDVPSANHPTAVQHPPDAWNSPHLMKGHFTAPRTLSPPQQQPEGMNLNHFRFVRKKTPIKSPLVYATAATDKRLYDALYKFRLAKDKYNVSLLVVEVAHSHLLKSAQSSGSVESNDKAGTLNASPVVQNPDVMVTSKAL